MGLLSNLRLLRPISSRVAVDLSKAFNFLARAPLGQLLCWMGIPPRVVAFWLHCLQGLSRCFQVSGCLSVNLEATTGAPEGDPASVLGMVAVCAGLASLLDTVSPHLYVDNRCLGGHREALEVLQSYTTSMRMVVDWRKSYVWAVSPVSKAWFKAHLASCLPADVTLPLHNHVKELGVQLQFNKRHCIHHLTPRLEEAARRLRRLFHDPSTIQVKARVVQSGIWPFACFGSFDSAPGLHHLHRLRSLAARVDVLPCGLASDSRRHGSRTEGFPGAA